MAVLGLAAGSSVLALCYPANVFTSLLLGKVRQEVTSTVTFGDGLTVLVGTMAGQYGYTVAYSYLFMCMANYLILIGDSVQASIYWEVICSPLACFIGAILLLPINQFRTLSGLTLLSMISFATVVATLILCLWTLLTNPSCESSGGSPGHGFLDYSSCISGFVFAFTGQNIMLEMQAEMKTPSDFPKAVWLSFSTLFMVYATVAVLSYLTCGEDTPGDLLLVLPHDWRKSAAGVLMVIHLMVTYTISQQVLSRAICAYLLPEALQEGVLARFKWFFVTSGMMAACFLVANLIPLFQDIVNLTGALLSSQVVFILPSVLFLAVCPYEAAKLEGTLATWIGCWCAIFLGICLALVGTVSSLLVIASKLSSGSGPFSC